MIVNVTRKETTVLHIVIVNIAGKETTVLHIVIVNIAGIETTVLHIMIVVQYIHNYEYIKGKMLVLRLTNDDWIDEIWYGHIKI